MKSSSFFGKTTIPLVFEDEWLVVVNKPPGLLVIPSPKNERRTLTSILNDDIVSRSIPYRLHPCHRLDKETSGLLIYAKGKSIQEKMMTEFQRHQVKKTYVAFVQGQLTKREGVLKMPVEGRDAVTTYKILERRKDFNIIQAKPLTGRTNQIRIHFNEIKHPLVGESTYAFRRYFALKAKRLCLHAEALEFTHPVTHKHIELFVDLPDDMMKFLEKHPD